MRVISCIVMEHNLWLVSLAAGICVAGAVITFRLFGHMRNRSGRQVFGWAFLAAVAAGSAIWCTHFIAMLAYEVKAPVTFDPILTFVSLVIAIVGCGLGFGTSAANRRFAPALGGAIAGLSIACMHYTGMMAYHVSGFIDWSPAYIVASVLIAMTFAAMALDEAVRQPRSQSHIIAPALFLVAIVGLHFTGMAAMEITPMAGQSENDNTSVFHALAVAVAGVALMIIGTGVASHLIDEMSAQENIAKLQHMAMNDSLSGLPNRVHFNAHMAREIELARENDGRLAVIGIDLDRFKAINDQHGHEAGDRVIAHVGHALGQLLKNDEFIARIGGDEFSALKRYEHLEDVHDFIARIETALNRSLELGDIQVILGGSIGVSLYPEDGDDMARLVSNADLAMYRAKGDPQRAVCFYEERMDDAARERSLIASDLRTAIANEELLLHYQVQGSVANGSITGYEVLLRWRHPMRGMVSPADFIPIAEETGSICEIGEWVLRTACREAGSWAHPHKIAVNVSGVQLQRADFAEVVHGILVETGFPPSRLELEITETAIVKDKTRALHIFRKLRALGIRVAIDDFGVGYSSLETLRLFPFDKIKIDRSFTSGLARDAQSMAIVRAVLALGKSLDVKVLAEGVETDQQLQTLRGEGCDEAQGYYLGRPQRTPSADTPLEMQAGAKQTAA